MHSRIGANRFLQKLGIIAIVVVSLILIFFFGGRASSTAVAPKYIFTPLNKCAEHHFVFVLGGYKTINIASPLFKSLLFHHRGPLVFHFIADKYARNVLPTLFDTWNLPSVRFHIYELENYQKEVDWIPNIHYSSIYGIIRLAIPTILPENVKEVLYIDTDVIVLNDISPIFDTFKGTSESVLFALAENLSPWYTQKNHWPAKDRGFNAGIMLFHLERMRKSNWSETWKKEAKKGLETRKAGNDQDILNLLALNYPKIMIEFPCEYNFQLGNQGEPLKCQKYDKFVKMAHFNSRQKLSLKSKFVVHFGRSYTTYQSMDGYVLRLREHCESASTVSTDLTHLTEKEADCGDLLNAIQTKFRTHLYFNGISPSNLSGDVTLITHLSVDRLHLFDNVLKAWEGPVSAAIYCTDAEHSIIGKYMKASHIARDRKNVALHAVFKTGAYYPINYLRKVALNASKTDYSFVSDVDFVPSEDLYTNLLKAVKRRRKDIVLVVPAFELNSQHTLEYPKTRDELLSAWDDGNIQPYGMDKWSKNSNDSDFDKWKDSESPIEIKWNPNYELAAVLPRQLTPFLDERFIGFGWHRESLLSALNDQGFRFLMVPSVFTVHQSHPISFELSRFTGSALYRKCMNLLQKQYSNDTAFKKMAQRAITNLNSE